MCKVSVHAWFLVQGQAVLVGSADCYVPHCLAMLWLGEACISILEMHMSPFGNNSLQGSMQALDGESTWWLQSCLAWHDMTSCRGLENCMLEKCCLISSLLVLLCPCLLRVKFLLESCG